jgi:hypothetical protein
MRQVAIFTEGQTELIFIRYLVGMELGWDKISIRCISLTRNKSTLAGLEHKNPHADVLFQITDVGNDESVLTAIKEREESLLKSGFNKILGLRDMYSEKYLKRSGRKIVPDVISQFIENAKSTIQKMSSPDKIFFHFAIMEVEAWFLAIWAVFRRLNTLLTVRYIEQKLSFRLDQIDPQIQFVNPSREVERILGLIGRKYDKTRGDVELICKQIEHSDIQTMLASGRCQSFKGFYTDIISSRCPAT